MANTFRSGEMQEYHKTTNQRDKALHVGTNGHLIACATMLKHVTNKVTLFNFLKTLVTVKVPTGTPHLDVWLPYLGVWLPCND